MQLIKKSVVFFAFIVVAFFAKAQTLKRAEILGAPTDKGVQVHLMFADSAQVKVQYGTTSGNYSGQTSWYSFAGGDPAAVTLSGLTPNTQYFYRVNYRSPGINTTQFRPEHSFYTQRTVGSTYSFVIQADPHMDEQSDTAVYALCLKNQLEDHPDFMIDLGDFLMTDKLKSRTTNQIPRDTIPYRCNLLRSYYEKINHSVPLFIANGNHEGESGWNLNGNANNIAVWGTLDRKKYFPTPTPDGFFSSDTTHYPFVGQRNSYYAWTWGDALFIVIDPYWNTMVKPDSLHGWRWSLGKVQYDWLRSTLENNHSKFKFVFAHHLVGGDPDGRGGVEFADLYEWGGKNLDSTDGFATNRPGWYKPIKDLFKENRVNVFFHGHDHFFGKQEKDCLIYQETPQPSHPNYTTVNYAAAYGYHEGEILPNSGYIRVTVNGDQAKVEYVRVYLPASESGTRHNKDVSSLYIIGARNCYDSLTPVPPPPVPVIVNTNYEDAHLFPNPSNGQTKVEFSMVKPEKISILVYNSAGQLVRKLVDGAVIPVGPYAVTWDGKSDGGASLANGTYFYSIRGETTPPKSGKLILLK